MKLTKEETKFHERARDLIYSDKKLSLEDKFFILENWIPDANHNVTSSGAFFTPYALAESLNASFFDEPANVIDLCAGIGMLAFAYWIRISAYRGRGKLPDITCIEINPDFVKVGKRILPEANWIAADVLTVVESGLFSPGSFDGCLSNPPFGNIPSKIKTPKSIISRTWEFAIAEIAMQLSDTALMIVPQGSVGWNYSGKAGGRYKKVSNDKYNLWSGKTGISFEPCSAIVDTKDGDDINFRSTKITVEIVDVIQGETKNAKAKSVQTSLPLFV